LYFEKKHKSSDMGNNKDEYRNFSASEPGVSVFSKGWWLDAVCGKDNWDVVTIKKNEVIVAALPFATSRRFIYKGIELPPFTPRLGPWVKYPEKITHVDQLSFEKDIFTQLINGLPKFDYFSQAFNPAFKNWLPFFWHGFRQMTKYTYIIEDISDIDLVVTNFSYAKKKNIKKAEKSVKIRFDLPAKEFYEHHKYTLAKQGRKIVYSFDLFERMYDAAYKNNSGTTIYAIDEQKNIHSALFVIWDDISAYDLISTIEPDYRGSGSASLLIREIIKHVSNKTKSFDFEGSMIENVENSFKQFGAIQTQYFKITKFNARILRLVKAWNNTN